nr:hypothetical protein [Tanacetum cinerariifolium]GEZ84814.1 hypothetical protein [Tanacetum cinerariifolium]
MAISTISVSSNSLEESVRTSTGRVILFGTIPTTIPDTTLSMIPPSTHIDTIPIPIVSSTIPPSSNYTPASPDYSSASDTESDLSEDPSSDHIPPLLATSPFLSSIDDSADIDIPDTPPSPTHGTPFTETTLTTQRSPAASGKRVGHLPTHRLAVRHLVDYSSSDHFALDDSSSSSSSKTSSDSSTDALSDSASSRSSSDHSLPAPSSSVRPNHHLCSLVPSIPRSSAAISTRPSHESSFTSPFRKRSRSLAAYVPLTSPILGALSYTRADLLPSPKRIRSSEFAMDLEGCSKDRFEPSRHRETNLEIDVDVVRVDRVTHPVIADDIPEPAQEEGAVEVTYETLGDLVQRFHDHTVKILVYRVQAIEGIQRDQGRMIVATGHQSTDMLERIRELERVDMRLRDMMDVASLRLMPGGIWATVLRLFLKTMPNTRLGASRTRKAVNEQIDHGLAGALGARDAARNLKPLMGNEGNENGGNGNEGNENDNRNGGGSYGYQQKDKIKAKPNKTEHGMERVETSKSKSTKKLTKSKVKDEAETKEILNGPTRTHLMGQ